MDEMLFHPNHAFCCSDGLMTVMIAESSTGLCPMRLDVSKPTPRCARNALSPRDFIFSIVVVRVAGARYRIPATILWGVLETEGKRSNANAAEIIGGGAAIGDVEAIRTASGVGYYA